MTQHQIAKLADTIADAELNAAECAALCAKIGGQGDANIAEVSGMAKQVRELVDLVGLDLSAAAADLKAIAPELDDSEPKTGWDIEPHVCRVCRGRVLSRKEESGTVHYRCASCGFKGRGNVESMCCCGVTWGVHGHIFHCAPNDVRSGEVPQEYLAFGELKRRQEPEADAHDDL